MTELINGKICKIVCEKDSYRGLVLSQTPNAAKFLTERGQIVVVNRKDFKSIEVARFTPETRKTLEAYWRQMQKRNGLQGKIDALRAEIGELNAFEHRLLLDLEKGNDDYNRDDFKIMLDFACDYVSDKKYDICTDITRNKGFARIQIETLSEVQKHIFPAHYDFLSVEYDGSIFVSDMESAAKFSYEKFSADTWLESLAKAYCTKVLYGARVGDKNTLFASAAVIFNVDALVKKEWDKIGEAIK